MNAVFRDLIDRKTVLIYLDDLIIPSMDCKTGIVKLEEVLRTASASGLIINWTKCQFLKTRVEFLGYIIENRPIRPSEQDTEAVAKFTKPTTIKQVQSFLGLTLLTINLL